MKKYKRIFEKEISVKDYENKPLTQFKEEFSKQLNKNNSDEEVFSEELKHIQKNGFNWKTKPNSQTNSSRMERNIS